MPKRKTPKRKVNKFFILGIACLLFSLAIPTSIFLPVAKAEIKYQVSKSAPQPMVTPTPIDQDFSIQIPKIKINTKVIANINPFEPKLYQQALTKGVAHAQGSSTPDKSGNIFIFAHSASSWYEANQFNAVFYLTSKLEKGDAIRLTYKNKSYDYQVSETKIVEANDVSYLANNESGSTLTLMTCWPPGTTAKRLLVIAKPTENIPTPPVWKKRFYNPTELLYSAPNNKIKFPAKLTSITDDNLVSLMCTQVFDSDIGKIITGDKNLISPKLLTNNNDDQSKIYVEYITQCSLENGQKVYVAHLGPCGGGCAGLAHIYSRTQDKLTLAYYFDYPKYAMSGANILQLDKNQNLYLNYDFDIFKINLKTKLAQTLFSCQNVSYENGPENCH